MGRDFSIFAFYSLTKARNFPDSALSAHQKAFQQALEAAGGRYVLAYSLDDMIIALSLEQ
jgi:hypothetical protein